MTNDSFLMKKPIKKATLDPGTRKTNGPRFGVSMDSMTWVKMTIDPPSAEQILNDKSLGLGYGRIGYTA